VQEAKNQYNIQAMYDAARAWVLAATGLLEEEQSLAVVLTEEAHTVAALIDPPSPTLPPALAGRVAPSDDDYEALLSFRSRDGHHVHWHSGLGPDGQCRQVVDLGHHLP
jgi:hypothetical protein